MNVAYYVKFLTSPYDSDLLNAWKSQSPEQERIPVGCIPSAAVAVC